MAYLVANNGPQRGTRYPLVAQEYILGRHPDSQIWIEVGAVSRQHAHIVREGQGYTIEDLNSRNGTFVNDRLLAQHERRPLEDGDRIRICDVEFTFFGDLSVTTASSDSSYRTVLVDDESELSSSTIMSKLEVSTASGRVQLSASPQAKLNALLEISQSLSRAVSLDAVLPQVLNGLFKIFVQADRGFIVLRTDDGSLAPRWTQTRRPEVDETIRISRTIVNEVMQTREAILSADAATDVRFEMSQSIADFRIRSMMCAPLVDSQGEAIGVLQIDTLDQRNRFADEDLEVLGSVASQAAIAIENAQLHEQLLRQREVDRDLQLAHEVQRAFLPSRRPVMPGYRFFDYYEPANQVGGDYFDYIPLPDGRLAVVVADVVGHGIAAAMLMAKLSAETRFCLAVESNPANAVTELNKRLSELELDRFVTLVMTVLDPSTHEATIVCAGHMPPIHRRRDGTLDHPGDESAGLPLAVTEGVRYEQTKIRLEPGETLCLYTDGIHEAESSSGEPFGMQRIRDFVQSVSSFDQLGTTIVNEVRAWIADGVQQDDMCIVCIERQREKGKRKK